VIPAIEKSNNKRRMLFGFNLGWRSMKIETKDLFEQIDAVGPDIIFDYQKLEIVTQSITQLLAGTRLLTLVIDKTHESRDYLFLDNYDNNSIKSYFEYFGECNPWAKHHSTLPTDVITAAQSRVPYAELVRTEFYHDWLKPMGEADDGLGTGLTSNEGASAVMLANFCYQRSDEDKAEIGRVLGEAARRLGRYLDFRHLTRAQDAARSGLIRQSRKPTWLLSREALIIDCNAEAEAHLRGRALFCRSLSGRLEGVDALAKQQLSEAFKQVQKGISAASLPVMRLRKPDDGHECMLVFTEAPAALDLGPLSALVPSRILAVLVEAQQKPSAPATERIASVFGLTKSEAQVASAIAAGMTIADFADQRHVSRLTVRNQLRSAMEKIGVSRQAELTATIQRMSGAVSGE
jgi:DNA-binding CsgD family transcriptional regulator